MGLRRVYEMTRRDHALHRRGLGQLMLRRWVQPCLRLRGAARPGDGAARHRRGGSRVGPGAESFAEVVARTVVAISPGSSDEVLRKVIVRDDAADETSKQGEVVVVLGLGTAFLAATSAFAQLERGANRIYGMERDRPSLHTYGLAMVLTTP